MGEKTNYYSIGEVSHTTNVPIKTLRYYDEIGLLVPGFRNEESNYRYYEKEQLLTLFIIRKLKCLGFPLKEIKTLVYNSDADSLSKCIHQRLDEILSTIESLKEQYSEGEFLLERLSMGNDILSSLGEDDPREHVPDSILNIQVEEIPLSNVIFTRKIQRNYKNMEVSIDRWLEIFRMVSGHKLKILGPVTLTYHNYQLEQFFNNNCDLEISVEVNGTRPQPEFKTYGGFLAVTAYHIGSNKGMINTHIEAIKWLNQNGYTICGPISERYIVSPVDIKNESSHITKIIIPVQKNGD